MNAIFNHTAHAQLWDWLAKNPFSYKYSWPGWKHNGGKYHSVLSHCFACETDSGTGVSRDCIACPLFTYSNTCASPLSIFRTWYETMRELNLYPHHVVRHEEGTLELVQIARAIRDWPLNRQNIEYYGIKVI